MNFSNHYMINLINYILERVYVETNKTAFALCFISQHVFNFPKTRLNKKSHFASEFYHNKIYLFKLSPSAP